MTVATVYARTSPFATGAANSAAINAAIAEAKANGLAEVDLGPGVLVVDATLNCGGDNQGIWLVGKGSLSQGSAPGNTVLKWTGGAAPVIDVTSSFHKFKGFSIQNSGSATHGIRAIGGFLTVDDIHFTGSAFSVASIEITNGVNYDRLRFCNFEAGPAVKVGGSGTTLLIEQFIMDSPVGSGAFVDIRGGIDVLTIREGTVNFREAMPTFIDMSNIGTSRVSVCRVENNEIDGDDVVAEQFTVATVKNCDNFIFEANQVDYLGNPANIESPITATDSRVTLRNNYMRSVNKPLVRTLDATSFVYSYEARQDLLSTAGLIEANSQSGNLIPVLIVDTEIIIQGDRASAMAHSGHLATLTGSAGTSYTVDIAKLTDSANRGFMTKGQVFTIVFYNNSGANLGYLSFNGTRFSIDNPQPALPPDGKRFAMTFQWDGATARELSRQYDPNPTWVVKAFSATPPLSSFTLSYGERRIAADASGGNITITLPRADYAKTGARFLIKKVTAANTVTINSVAGFTFDGAASVALTAQWSMLKVESDGTQWLIV